MAEKTTEELLAEMAKLKEQNSKLRADKQEQADVIKEQAKELRIAEANKPKGTLPIVALQDGRRLVVKHGVSIRIMNPETGKAEQQRFTRDELAKRPDVCTMLIDSKSSAVELAKGQ